MRVVFNDEALDDLRLIYEWIAKDDPRAADALIARIFDKAERLSAYIIVYKVFDNRGEIAVLTVIHGAQDRSTEDESE